MSAGVEWSMRRVLMAVDRARIQPPNSMSASSRDNAAAAVTASQRFVVHPAVTGLFGFPVGTVLPWLTACSPR